MAPTAEARAAGRLTAGRFTAGRLTESIPKRRSAQLLIALWLVSGASLAYRVIDAGDAANLYWEAHPLHAAPGNKSGYNPHAPRCATEPVPFARVRPTRSSLLARPPPRQHLQQVGRLH